MRTHNFLLGLVLATALAAPRSAAEEIPPAEAIGLLERATKAIHSFDLYLSIRQTNFAGYEPPQRPAPGKNPVLVFRPLRPGEDTNGPRRWYRQALSKGKRRIDTLDAPEGKADQMMAFDGEIERFLDVKQKWGYIRPLRPATAVEGADYLTFYRTVYGKFELVKILRQRKHVRAEAVELGDKKAVLIECAAEPEASIQYPLRAFKVWLDPEHGLLPRRVDTVTTTDRGPVTRTRTVVDEFKQLDSGVWVPIQATTTFYVTIDQPMFGKPYTALTATVDVRKSRWNTDIPPDTFVLKFPPGTQIVDRIRKVGFIAGDADPGRNMADLVKSAKQIIPLDPATPPLGFAEKPPLRYALLLYSFLGLALAVSTLAGWLYLRQRRVVGQNGTDPRSPAAGNKGDTP
jgi:hypothetical protein